MKIYEPILCMIKSGVITVKTYTICGSMQFTKQMKDISWNLETVHGYNVLQCVYNEQSKAIDEKTVEKLNKTHYKKIELSDGIYVVDIDGYIGSAVKAEIEYATQSKKEVIYHSEFNMG